MCGIATFTMDVSMTYIIDAIITANAMTYL